MEKTIQSLWDALIIALVLCAGLSWLLYRSWQREKDLRKVNEAISFARDAAMARYDKAIKVNQELRKEMHMNKGSVNET